MPTAPKEPASDRLFLAPQPPPRHSAPAPAPDSPPKSVGRRNPRPLRAPGPAPPAPSGPCRTATGATAAAVHAPRATSAPPCEHPEGRAHEEAVHDADAALPHPSRTGHSHRREHTHQGHPPPHPRRLPHRRRLLHRRQLSHPPPRAPFSSDHCRSRPPHHSLPPFHRLEGRRRRSPRPEPAFAPVSTPELAPAPLCPTARTPRGRSTTRGTTGGAARPRARGRKPIPTLTWNPATKPCEMRS